MEWDGGFLFYRFIVFTIDSPVTLAECSAFFRRMSGSNI